MISKNKTTFAVMMKLLFNIFFLLTVIFCTGLNAQSNFLISHNIIEHPAVSGDANTIIGADFDPIDDDQINLNIDICHNDEHEQWIKNQQRFCLIHNFNIAFWQPPKTS
jgi:hypothetical protein